MLIKAKPIRLCASHLCPIRDKNTSWCTSPYLHDLLSTCDQAHTVQFGVTSIVCKREKALLAILHEQQPSPQHSRKFSVLGQVGAYRLEAFSFYRSLEHSHLNLKPNFSHASSSRGSHKKTRNPSLATYSIWGQPGLWETTAQNKKIKTLLGTVGHYLQY